MMTEEFVRIPVEKLRNFMKDVFIGAGVPPDDAEICSDVLIAADLRGIDSHGIQRLKMYIDRIKKGIQYPITEWKIIKENQSSALIDANNGMGHVVSYHAMNLAIEKAKNTGCAAVAVKNSSHFGIDGYYPLMAVDRGMVGMAFTNARPAIAPTFGVTPMMGTNPIAFACPTDDKYPFCFDAATSISQRGKIEVAKRAGKKVPVGWVIDEKGEDMTEPEVILQKLLEGKASMLPLGGVGETLAGYKGYGLAAIVEILSTAFQDGPYLTNITCREGDKLVPYRLGHFFMAINISSFIDLEVFKRVVGGIVRTLKSSDKAPGAERIWVAGEKEFEMIKKRQEEGIPVNKSLQADIKTIISDLDISGYHFPF